MKLGLCLAFAACACLACASPSHAGVVNPDISFVGQPFVRWTSDAADPARKRIVFDPGETEIVFDAALNPYARGFATLAAGEEGLELEEGYFALLRGLPGDLQIRGGKYRVGFGRLNPVHPHAYPFAERFRVLAEYLPGEESLNETGVRASKRFAFAGDASVEATVDLLQGDSYRFTRESSGAANDPLLTVGDDGDRTAEPRPATAGRLAAFTMLSERSALEFGVSGTLGTNNVAASTRTTLFGADAKAKLWNGPDAYLVLQGEVLRLHRDDAGWDETTAAYTSNETKATGFYLYADYNFARRYNAGMSFESYQATVAGAPTNRSFGAFAGLALMEESTLFRLAWGRFDAGGLGGADLDPIDTVTLKVVFSMGPHKPHAF